MLITGPTWRQEHLYAPASPLVVLAQAGSFCAGRLHALGLVTRSLPASAPATSKSRGLSTSGEMTETGEHLAHANAASLV